MKYAYLGFLVACILCGPRQSRGVDLKSVLSSDPAVVQQAIANMRDACYAGLNPLLDQYDHNPDPELIPATDAVAGQRGALLARLFWYTDLDRAEAAARAQHKPILYLRMMGKLTDEYSCANSRFFRTVLYANAGVSKLLREQFILVWCSERPVPVVTIDYGDGRVLKRTLTGNSIHYVLDEEGRVIDALPGLYDPKTFSAILNDARGVVSSGALDQPNLAKYFVTRQEGLRRAYWNDVRRIAPAVAPVAAAAKPAGKNPDARKAARMAVGKSLVELPILARISPEQQNALLDESIDLPSNSIWPKLATLHLADAALDPASIAVIRSQNPAAYDTPGVLDRTVEQFQRSIALDTVHNNYQFRRRILSWLRQTPAIALEDLNRRAYSELFLTPRSDPWLGLVPDATYSALPADGCAVKPACR